MLSYLNQNFKRYWSVDQLSLAIGRDFKIEVKSEGDFFLFRARKYSDLSTGIPQECNGSIYRFTDHWTQVSRPWTLPGSGNGEEVIENRPVFQIWWNPESEKFHISSLKKITVDLPFPDLEYQKQFTYLISQINSEWHLVGARNLETGDMSYPDMGIPIIPRYPITEIPSTEVSWLVLQNGLPISKIRVQKIPQQDTEKYLIHHFFEGTLPYSKLTRPQLRFVAELEIWWMGIRNQILDIMYDTRMELLDSVQYSRRLKPLPPLIRVILYPYRSQMLKGEADLFQIKKKIKTGLLNAKFRNLY